MYYLMPAWNEKNLHLNFDYMASQARIFLNQEQPFMVMIINYMPTLRYQLHKNQLMSIDVWNVYDQIQDIKVTFGHPLGIDDFDWPNNIKKIYTPFGVNILKNDCLYAQLKVYDDQFIYQVDYFEDNQLVKCQWYDDRGFLSREDLVKTNQVVSQLYYNQNEDLVLVVNEQGEVNIEPAFSQNFSQSSYVSLNSLVVETITKFLKQRLNDVDIIAEIAVHQLDQIEELASKVRILALVKGKNMAPLLDDNLEQVQRILHLAKVIITDDRMNQKAIAHILAIKSQTKLNDAVQIIPPFATSLKLGESNNLNYVQILWHIALQSTFETTKVFEVLVGMILADKQKRLLVYVNNHSQLTMARSLLIQAIAVILEKDEAMINHILENIDENQLEIPLNQSENDIDNILTKKTKTTQNDDKKIILNIIERVSIEIILNNKQVNQALAVSRLIIDLGQRPDLYLQINAISTGIPQITANQTPYIKVNQNGKIVNNIEDFKSALRFFLDNIGYWNQALVANIKLLAEYDEHHILTSWEGLLKNG